MREMLTGQAFSHQATRTGHPRCAVRKTSRPLATAGTLHSSESEVTCHLSRSGAGKQGGWDGRVGGGKVWVVLVQAADLGFQDAPGAAERSRRVGQFLGPEQHDQDDRDDQDLPRAVEKAADHGRSPWLVMVL